MTQDVWNYNQKIFTQMTGLQVKGNEQTYLIWLNTSFTLEMINKQDQLIKLLSSKNDTKR